ncbi:tRNA (adenosine(37)-N6)-threonylcarbamoyltransferase complex transferase subunit TsaD [Thermoflavifilum thermophilum]|uniref:tRNA N6-adenosine threonylcarbamoyltransferase n=1 Tax=Thermoflavifilum thermophilum TaxID=1393122 RepID=A0A1I7NM59_9BACT|nr:tRNA (adenosine(37)-N6)-threonylcarbamoyltransferase complex transferase subunit TsaD [Thermoflavifilum thermophilum]SFV35726.1 N6-L-threonylcarbamoyladenine synthase [Thermoflavifilum thermophilum]
MNDAGKTNLHHANPVNKTITLLAIESSCDETSAAVIRDGKVLANLIANQKIHEQYGGVVPELASRAHMQNIVPVVDLALKQAGVEKNELQAIAFTQSPGLIGSLLVGASFAKALAVALNIPLIAVHHMKAHVLANCIDEPRPSFPFLCLTVSGGHTQIVLCKDYLDMEIIGQTIDDAAGEAFDKTAKLLGLPYPGGPLIDRYAQQGNPHRFHFPRPQVPGYDYSFSGLKTAILYFLREQSAEDASFIEKNLPDICASVQQTIIDILMQKLIKAAEDTGIREVCIAGGVSANKGLRKRLLEEAEKRGWHAYIPDFQYCTDNAGMIGFMAYHQYLAGAFTDLRVTPSARGDWKMAES